MTRGAGNEKLERQTSFMTLIGGGVEYCGDEI